MWGRRSQEVEKLKERLGLITEDKSAYFLALIEGGRFKETS